MGLDMYLSAELRFSKYGKDKGVMAKKLRAQFGVPDTNNLETVEIKFEIGYWRKANQIHAWFVNNLAGGKDDQAPIYVSREDLEKLLADVETVLKSTKLIKAKIVNGYELTGKGKKAIIEEGEALEDFSVAEKLLPTQAGFFFGSTSYDQYYWQDLISTKEIIERALALGKDYSFEYQASW